MVKLIQPQELEVFYVLPALRRELTKELINKGLEQKEIAKLLHVSAPSISHYIHSKRAVLIQFQKKIKDEVKKSAEKLVSTKDLIISTQELIIMARNDKITCKLCQKINNQPYSCNVCFK
ncbi:hypothetical protein HYV79_04545 [Candidatus Woesearchaeota archaeon]|nr:hypothetical protein [Candidatus Woesearchaeota archaeon]